MRSNKIKLFGLDVDNPKTLNKLFAVVIILWFSCYGLTRWLVQDRGTFGDLFGSANALFSGLAFAGIIYTILLQREELGEQRQQLELNRQELELTRKEMELARVEYNQQNQTLSLQRFENTFFQLLNSFEKTDNAVLLRNIKNSLVSEFNNYNNVLDKEDKCAEHFEIAIAKSLNAWSRYLNSLDAILKLISNQNFKTELTDFYYSLVHSKLYLDETAVLQYYSRLSLDADQTIKERVKRLISFSGISSLNEKTLWLFSEYPNLRDKLKDLAFINLS